MKPLLTFWLTVGLLAAAVNVTIRAGQFEDLGIPVKKAGLMGFVVGPACGASVERQASTDAPQTDFSPAVRETAKHPMAVA